MSVSKHILKVLNTLVSAVVAIFLLGAGVYSSYALWDNAQVYAAADNVQEGLFQVKPVLEAEDNGPTFEELMAINPDVCAWLTLTNTKTGNVDTGITMDILPYIVALALVLGFAVVMIARRRRIEE